MKNKVIPIILVFILTLLCGCDINSHFTETTREVTTEEVTTEEVTTEEVTTEEATTEEVTTEEVTTEEATTEEVTTEEVTTEEVTTEEATTEEVTTEEATTEEVTTEETTIDLEDTVYISYDIEDFIAQYAHTSKDQTNILYSSQATSDIIIPTLVSDEYVFSFVEVNEYAVRYYYVPKDYKNTYFDYDVGIVVTASKEDNSFEATTKKYGLSVDNGKAFDAKYNEIFVNNKGYLISIAFPKNILITKIDQLNDYFSFKALDDLNTQIK